MISRIECKACIFLDTDHLYSILHLLDCRTFRELKAKHKYEKSNDGQKGDEKE